MKYAKLKAVEYCVHNNELVDSKPAVVLQNITRIIEVENQLVNEIRVNIDAKHTPDDLNVSFNGKKHVIVWFQCPWNSRPHTSQVIKDFLVNMSRKQINGDYVLIGIANHFPYVKEYKLQELLGEDFKRNTVYGYRFCGPDVEFVKMILAHGYHHEGIRDIHDKIYSTHTTLVFRK